MREVTVERHDGAVTAHQYRERTDCEAAEDRDRERGGEQQASRGGGTRAGSQEVSDPRLWSSEASTLCAACRLTRGDAGSTAGHRSTTPAAATPRARARSNGTSSITVGIPK